MESVATNHSESLGWMERLITELSSEMIRVPFEELTAAIDDALRRVGEELEVDRVALIQIVDDSSIAKVSEWLNAALPFAVDADSDPFKELVQSPPIADTPIVLDHIGDQLLTGVRTGLSDGYDQPSPLKSAVVVPVTIPGALRCALAVAVVHGYRSWPEIIVERLRLVAEILTTAWHRHTQELALRQSRSELARLATRLDRDTHETGKPPKVVPSFEEIVGDSPALHAALARLQEVAAGDTTVLLLGETGTGKELFARALHARSPRRPFPMISVNCAALPPTLIESELFGHERGAFTGAMTQRQGRFELAHRGTLFLDEIGDLPLDLQAKLLRVLQEGEFERLGASHSRKVDVRIVAATHRDLDEEVREARFREDLYYRLNVFAIRLPPLRERRSDIPPWSGFSSANGRRRCIAGSSGSRTKSSSACSNTRGPATSASWRTSSSAPSFIRPATRCCCSTTTSVSVRRLAIRHDAGVGRAVAHRRNPARVRRPDQRTRERRRASRHAPQHPAIPNEASRHRSHPCDLYVLTRRDGAPAITGTFPSASPFRQPAPADRRFMTIGGDRHCAVVPRIAD
jgi:transcriptional regulator with GAF, ATPase, and Fis domain